MTEPGGVVRHLETAYGARLRLVRNPVTRRDGRPLLIHTRTDAGQFTIDEIDLPGGRDGVPGIDEQGDRDVVDQRPPLRDV